MTLSQRNKESNKPRKNNLKDFSPFYFYGDPPEEINKITVWTTYGLGDNLLSYPLLIELRKKYPKAQIRFHGEEGVGQLFKSLGIVDENIVEIFEPDGHGALEVMARPFRLIEESPNRLVLVEEQEIPLDAKFLFTEALGWPDVFIGQVVALPDVANGIKRLDLPCWTLGWAIPPYPCHMAEYYIRIAQQSLNLKYNPPYQLPSVDLNENLKDKILMSAGSGKPWKNWSHFQRLAENLDSEVIFIGKEKDVPDNWTGKTELNKPLLEYVSMLQSCKLYIGNDSGVTHLASLAGAPTLALFGPTDPETWGPIGPKTKVIRTCQTKSPLRTADFRCCWDKNCINKLTYKLVLQEIQKDTSPFRGCTLHS